MLGKFVFILMEQFHKRNRQGIHLLKFLIDNSYRLVMPMLIIIFAIFTISAYLGDEIRQFCE